MSTSIPQGLFPAGEIPNLWLYRLLFPPTFDALFQVITAEAKIYSGTWSFHGATKHNVQRDF